MELQYIIVQAGGKGTRMEYLTKNKPKALTPIGEKPMIFHLFDKYPDKKFIVIGDYKYDVLDRYLSAFAKVDYKMVNAHGKSGTCGGVSEALQYIPDGSAFMMIWCDLILPDDFNLPEDNKNYVGISKDFRCRWSWDTGKFENIPSMEHGVAGLFIFENKSVISNVPEEGEFVRWLSEGDIEFNELPLYRTKEYGLLKEWETLPEQRCRPFNRITIDGDRLIKEGIDEQGKALAKREIAWYKKVSGKGLTQIPNIYSFEPLVMDKIDGKNIYEYNNLSKDEKTDILKKLINSLKSVHCLEIVDSDVDSLEDAYITKTFARLSKVKELVPFAKDEFVIINGKKCRNVFYHVSELESAIRCYYPDKFNLIHGDCTFSNIILRKDGVPILIDPRGYFGHTELYGDTAYDWAKLYYSVFGNYDQFNLKRFKLDILDNEVKLEIDSNGWEDMQSTFFELLKDDVDEKQIKLLHAIIWLSLTTYAWQDYDSICGAFYNGLYYLEEVL